MNVIIFYNAPEREREKLIMNMSRAHQSYVLHLIHHNILLINRVALW